MDLEQHFAEIEDRGFSVVPGVVPPGDLPILRDELEAALKRDLDQFGGRPGKQSSLVVELVTQGSSFVDLLTNPTMHAVFDRFLTNTCILYSFTSTVLRPGEQPGSAAIHNDTPRRIPGYHAGLVMTLAVDDFRDDNGATKYLPGSHLDLEPPSESAFDAGAVSVARNAGDAVFFHPRVYHRAGSNRTGETRYGLTIYACRSFMRQRFDYPRLVSPDVLSRCGERGRQFLGFDVRVPVGPDEFYVDESERLYRAGQG